LEPRACARARRPLRRRSVADIVCSCESAGAISITAIIVLAQIKAI
jgi:hypothetical protein